MVRSGTGHHRSKDNRRAKVFNVSTMGRIFMVSGLYDSKRNDKDHFSAKIKGQ